ncbi:EpsG family protein [Psychrobacillus psychrotolerans]|uniref:EpsG family protein n=1 Tax=Psychrobacillus psychrotolerans TaxID=126156 RepID=A0A1I5Z5A9_9BACI|nr:EpsG family protein [Psychrobacillus psychrotolerans]SFQ51630.1 EpsG family protein [Psychrobacillus psychrotolerans]
MFLLYFLILYLIIISIIFENLPKSKQKSLVLIILSFGLLAFLAMFRSIDVGNDTYAYFGLFQQINSGIEISAFSHRYETGFLYLNKFLSFFSDDYQVIPIFSSIYIYILVGRFIFKYSKNIGLSVILFFALGYFDLSMSGIRQMMAIATLLLSYEALIKNKKFSFFFTVLLATSFHNAAVIFLLAYPLINSKIKRKHKISIVFLAGAINLTLPIILSYITLFLPKYSSYLDSTYFDGTLRFATVVLILMNLTLYVLGESINSFYLKNNIDEGLREKDTLNKRNLTSLFIFLSIVFLFLSINGTILSRFTNIFGIFMIVYLPNELVKIKNLNLKAITVSSVTIVLMTYLIIEQVYRPEWQSTYPYSFFFLR